MLGQNGVFYLGGTSVSPPAGTSGLASNGLSVDPTSGDYVLGNDQGDAAKPARLLNMRQIDTEGNFIFLQDEVNQPLGQTVIGGASLQLSSGAGGVSLFQLNSGNNDFLQIAAFEGSGSIIAAVGNFGSNTWVNINMVDGSAQYGNAGTDFNGAVTQVNGAITGQMLYIPISGSAPFDVERDKHSNVLLVNPNAGLGLATVNLPLMASSVFVGFHIYVAVMDADGIELQANAGQTIYIDGSTSSVAGTATSVTPGSTIHLVCVNPQIWMAIGVNGTWVLA